MATNLGVRPSNIPLPMGIAGRRIGASHQAPAWPGVDNFILPGDGAGGMHGPFNRPERFWLHCGATFICSCAYPGWISYYYKWQLVVNGSYGPDLLGSDNRFQKVNSGEQHPDGWFGTSVEGLYYCEANTDYSVYLLSGGGGASCNYYQSEGHYNIWAYTVGEGAY